jgi:hypothetical protein
MKRTFCPYLQVAWLWNSGVGVREMERIEEVLRARRVAAGKTLPADISLVKGVVESS